ncbi:YcxB family protein [Clostridium sp. UBA4548]|uniref:YcxB family protein n=1 Tax=Clostridium sp. UBA4548 TaxID=1946361 RepID=UPI0025BF1034|nr:YcxB family protein [Clostridium sp. UBA4548]
MKISYELTKEDYMEFNMHHIFKTKSIRTTLFIERFVISIMFLLVPFLMKPKGHIPFAIFFMPFAIIYVGWLVFFPKYFKGSIKRRLERMLNKEENKSLFGPQQLSITDVGIFEFDNLEKSKVTMKDVEKVEVTESYTYIYISDMNAYIIPHRAFKTLSEKNELIDLLKKHCKVCVE